MPATPRRVTTPLGLRAAAALSAALLSALSVRAADIPSDDKDVAAFLEATCVRCHDGKRTEGEFRIDTLAGDPARIADFERVLDRLAIGDMPPLDEPQPSEESRRRMIGAINGLLDRAAQTMTGDPGPAPVRRLTNAEYDNTIRDLTGVDLKPTRTLPPDGAAGEGFSNTAEALALPEELLTKYLAVAKDVAAHAVLLPDGFRFSPFALRGDHEGEIRDGIRAMYRKYADDFGAIPLERYVKATLQHRDVLRSGGKTPAAVADLEGLSPIYLDALWKALTDERPSLLLDRLREAWNTARADDAGMLAAVVVETQGIVFGRQGSADYKPHDMPIVDRQTIRKSIPDGWGHGGTFFLLHVRTLRGDPATVRVILEQPRYEDGKGETLQLATVLHTPVKRPADLPAGVSLLDAGRLVSDGDAPGDGPTSVRLMGNETLLVVAKGDLRKHEFTGTARLDPASPEEAVVFVEVNKYPDLLLDRFLEWGHHGTKPRDGKKLRPLLAGPAVRSRDPQDVAAEIDRFRGLFPAVICWPPIDDHSSHFQMGYARADKPLQELFLDAGAGQRLDRLWTELYYVSDIDRRMAEAMAGNQGKRKYSSESHPATKKRKELEPGHVDALVDFAARAYRRPLAAPEQTAIRAFYTTARDGDGTLDHESAFRATLARVLMSPSFLMRLDRPGPGAEPGPVGDWDLASRLSYFLWSSMPDEELRQAAAAGGLNDPQALAAQVRRMIADPRSRALAVEFGTQWLELRTFESFAGKDEELYPMFDEPLRRDMKEEAVQFFADLFRSDRPIDALLDADHAFLNGRLAAFYGIPGVEGEEFRRVDGVRKHGRGGLLGLGAVLARHSNASRTSPVLRGSFVSEVVLGLRLPKPPPDVPTLQEVKTGELTVRQLVEMHAKAPGCAACHDRIDPFGFALEEFDTIGRRRTEESPGRPIDATSVLRDGTTFVGVDGLKKYLLAERKNEVLRQFGRKLVGFALGRDLGLGDRQLVNDVVTELAREGGRPSKAVEMIVTSRQFRQIRGLEYVAGE